tara:strand:- start:345 stop:500 length:156 start_codon:yes stop_codon:yes gene_type:complete
MLVRKNLGENCSPPEYLTMPVKVLAEVYKKTKPEEMNICIVSIEGPCFASY